MVARIEALEKATADDMAAIHADRVCIPARELVGLLGRLRVSAAAEPHRDDKHWRAALTRLAAWDGVMDKDQVAPAIYAALRERLMRDLMTPILGPLAPEAFATVQGGGVAHMVRIKAQLAEMIGQDNRSLLPAGAEWPAVLASALAGAVSDLRAALGDDMDAWRWERLHTTRPVHPLVAGFPKLAATLNPPAVAVGGDGETVNAAGFVPGAGYPSRSRPWPATSSTSPTGSRAAGSCPTAPPAIPAARTGPTSSRPGPIAASCPCGMTGPALPKKRSRRRRSRRRSGPQPGAGLAHHEWMMRQVRHVTM